MSEAVALDGLVVELAAEVKRRKAAEKALGIWLPAGLARPQGAIVNEEEGDGLSMGIQD